MTVNNSYMITNRAKPGFHILPEEIVPLSGSDASKLWWYMSTDGVNDTDVGHYVPQPSNPTPTPTTTAPSSFMNDLVAQLGQQGSSPQLIVYVHGMSNDWTEAVTETGTFGQWLVSQAGYTGLMIGFSWPSYGEIESPSLYASSYAFPPPRTHGTLRDNIGGSRESFGNLMSFLQNIMAKVSGLSVSIICHSEGNYMGMVGLFGKTSVVVSQILLIAGDMNNAALQQGESTPYTGQGSGISANADRVTVYYSASDNLLATAVAVYGKYHNPEFGGRLGVVGPSFDYGSQSPNVVGVDCSLVVNNLNVDALEANGKIPSDIDLHSSYRYVPQILKDIVETTGGQSSGSILNRSATAVDNSYLMNLVPATSDSAQSVEVKDAVKTEKV